MQQLLIVMLQILISKCIIFPASFIPDTLILSNMYSGKITVGTENPGKKKKNRCFFMGLVIKPLKETA